MSTKQKRPLRIAITSGDFDGIGPEIVAKSLAKLGPKRNIQFYLWRNKAFGKANLRRIDRAFQRTTVATWPEALNRAPGHAKEIIDICSNTSPAHWVQQTAEASLLGEIDAIATAPLSKTSIRKAGFSEIGHTEIFQTVSGAKHLHMCFIGKEFHVVLVTGHKALSDVPKALTDKTLISALKNAQKIRDVLPKTQAQKPLALLGLNPHAGEEGLIGSEEKTLFKKAYESLKRAKVPFDGPLVPDTAFFKTNWKKYSLFVCPYHDQGLIPFKMIHGQDSGVHITLGLPFIRTSVDHGTAKDIFGRNKANPASMIEALEWAIKLARKK